MLLEFNGRRGHICNTGWDKVDAEVACTEFNRDSVDAEPSGKWALHTYEHIGDFTLLYTTATASISVT